MSAHACFEDPAPADHAVLHCSAASINTNNVGALPAPIDYEIVARYPHRQQAFSQGLIYHGGFIYESSGLYAKSSVAKLVLDTAEVLKSTPLDKHYFAEGLTLFNNQLIQLTWKSNKVMRYDAKTLAPLKSSSTIDGEGWGLTHNGISLINSNGSATLYWRDPNTLKILNSAQIRYGNRLLNNINELEWVNGCILANIWHSDTVVVINPVTAQVEHTLDLRRIAQPERQINREHVANGIAYRQDNGNLLVTGKNWRYLYELRLIKTKADSLH